MTWRVFRARRNTSWHIKPMRANYRYGEAICGKRLCHEGSAYSADTDHINNIKALCIKCRVAFITQRLTGER